MFDDQIITHMEADLWHSNSESVAAKPFLHCTPNSIYYFCRELLGWRREEMHFLLEAGLSDAIIKKFAL